MIPPFIVFTFKGRTIPVYSDEITRKRYIYSIFDDRVNDVHAEAFYVTGKAALLDELFLIPLDDGEVFEHNVHLK